MKVSWNAAPLGDLASFRNGLWTGKKAPFSTARVIRNTNIRRYGRLSLDDVAEIEVESKQLETRRLQYGDIILERSGGGPKQAVGRAVCFELDEPDFSFSNFTSAIRIRDRGRLSHRFLHLVLNWWYETGVTERIQSNSTGIRNLDFAAYKELEVPLPPLEEQQRIVAVLDEAFEGLVRARTNAEANLRDATQLFEALLAEALRQGDWPITTLNEMSENLDRKRVPITKADRKAGYVPYYGASGVVDHVADFLFDEDLLLISEDGANLLARTYPIAFSITGRSWVNNHAHVLRFRDRDTQEYVRLYLNSMSLEPYVSGMAQPKLNQAQLNRIPIPYPPASERAEIVARFELVAANITDLQLRYQSTSKDVEELRQSLLIRAFEGKLT